jgi:hypothetical protein
MRNNPKTGLKQKNDFKDRWRIGSCRQEITSLKQNGCPSRGMPKFDHRYDYRGANLRMAKLVNAKINSCDFTEAILYQARLDDSDLEDSIFMEADLTEAVLDGANLVKVNLINAKLVKASIRNANFEGANLKGADLKNADISGARIQGAILDFCDLRGIHIDNPIIGCPKSANKVTADKITLDLLSRSHAKETIMVENNADLAPIAFLSYKWSEADEKWVRRLAKRLRSLGINALFDGWEIRPGDSITEFIARGIGSAGSVVLVVTPEAVNKIDNLPVDGNYLAFESELSTALRVQGKLRLIPVLLRGNELPIRLTSRRYIDFRDKDLFNNSTWMLAKTILGEDEKAPPIVFNKK